MSDFQKISVNNYNNPAIRKLTFSSIKDEESSKKMYLFYYTLWEIFWNTKMHNIQSYVDTCGGNEEFSSYINPILDNKIKLHSWLNNLSDWQKCFWKIWSKLIDSIFLDVAQKCLMIRKSCGPEWLICEW